MDTAIIFDYVTTTPWDELQSAWERAPSTEFAHFGSLKGRLVCVWKTGYHAAAIVLKPAVYLIFGSLVTLTGIAMNILFAQQRKISTIRFGIYLILTGLVCPLGQILQVFKAAMGMLHPGCYFKEDELHDYFMQLATIAEAVKCEPEFVNTLKQGASIIARSQQVGHARVYYNALFKRDLAIICEKLSTSEFTPDEKMAILNMLAPLPSDPHASGVSACPPGLGRLLEQICACLDVPKEPEKIVSWLVNQYKEEIIHQMVMQAEICGKYVRMVDHPDFKGNHDAAHLGNIFLVVLGEKVNFPQEIIDKASEDLLAQVSCLPENEQQELFEQFNQLYKEQELMAYLLEHINSQPDGKPGLKELRNHMIQTLTEHVSSTEIDSTKEEVQKRFALSETLADEPIFFVKLHYFLYPDVEPQEECSSDLNEQGIRAFCATLEENPLSYFAERKIRVG